MKRSLMIAGVALLATWGVSTTVLAQAEASQGSEVNVCPSDCTKPCCAKKAAVKSACPDGCTKPCCAKKAAACGVACDKTSGACPVGAKKACDKSAGSCPMKKGVAVINTQALKALMDAGAKVTVLDARTGKYDDGRRIPGAKSLSSEATEKDVRKAVRKKDQLVVTYCGNLQCPASGMLAEHLKALGYKNVIEYPMGIAGWAEAGNDVENVK